MMRFFSFLFFIFYFFANFKENCRSYLIANTILRKTIRTWKGTLFMSFFFFNFCCCGCDHELTLTPTKDLSPSRLGLQNTPTASLQGGGVRLPQWVFWIWHISIWWWGSSNAGALGNMYYTFIAIFPKSTLAQSGSTS